MSPPSLRACASCGRPVDTLRAPVVAILEGAFVYFCSVECKRSTPALSVTPPPVAERVTPSSPRSAPPWVEPLTIAPSASVAPIANEPEKKPPPAPPRESPQRFRLDDPPPESLPPSLPPPSFIRRAHESARANENEGRLPRVAALVVASVGVAFGLIETTGGIVRLGIASGAVALMLMLVASARVRVGRARPLERALQMNLGAPHASAIGSALLAVVFAWVLRLLEKPGATTAANMATWVVLAAATAEWVANQGTRATLAGARAVLATLEPEPSSRDVEQEGKRVGDVVELRPGAPVLYDVRLIGGSITCDLWGNPALRARRVEGDPVPAGAVVRSGSATARVGAVGRDRAFARLLTDALERSDRASPRLRALDRSAPIVAVAILAVAIAVGVFSSGGNLLTTLVAGVAAGLSVLVPPARRLAVRDQLAGIIEACRNGVAIRDADAFARAGGVRTAIFCLRGALVSSVPDTCDVEPLGEATTNDVLALAAGAEIGLAHPIAAAIARAAQARSVRPVDVRNVAYEPGFGVRGELSSGATVVVGSRGLCLRAHVPTAEHEARINELEATGRDVVIVARDGRPVGLVALQYPLRTGALASVQRLHDIEVEPVLLGGATRGRLEAIGKAVDVEHVRPEIPARDRGGEVRRIAQSAGPVAVIGAPLLDGVALAAADVPIALGEAGAAPDTPAVALSHDRLVAAVDVLALAQATRARVAATIAVGLAPVVIAALPVAFALIRPTYAPLAALAATVALGVRDLVAAALPEGGRMEDN